MHAIDMPYITGGPGIIRMGDDIDVQFSENMIKLCGQFVHGKSTVLILVF